MTICLKMKDGEHCFNLTLLAWPFGPYRPGPGPVNYPAFLHDATIVGSIYEAIGHVQDESVRKALEAGVNNSVTALKSRGGDYVSKITLGDRASDIQTGGTRRSA